MEQFVGLHEVEFANGETKRIDVRDNIVDSKAHPIFLVAHNGTLYNWMNIISIRRT